VAGVVARFEVAVSGDLPRLRVPVGDDAVRWRTFPSERTLVVAARTLTSTVRVLEVLPGLLRDDPRVAVVFAYDATSAFNDGVLELLRTAGCRVMPWEQLGAADPDLILSASENIDVPDGGCPVLVLPHGIGFQKFVPDARSSGTRLSGMVPDSLLASGRGWLAISHPDQEAQLVAAHPGIAGRMLLTGDPCFDELAASLPSAGAYRDALGVRTGQRLVVVSSTWGPTSLIGQDPALPGRLLAELPLDEYRVAAVLHPNVWSGHGAWQVRTLLASAREAGLLLVPPAHAWRPTLVAADLVVADHGSVGLYAAALGKPVVLAAFGDESVPRTAAEDLARTAPRLLREAPLRPQIERALDAEPSGGHGGIRAKVFAEPGHALARLRSAVYDLMKLSDRHDGMPPVLTLPSPEVPPAVVTSWWAAAMVAADEEPTVVTVRRHPASVARRPEGEPGVVWHLACCEQERDSRLTESASVLVHRAPAASRDTARAWVKEALERYPGSWTAVAALPSGGCLAGLRGGTLVEVAGTGRTVAPDLLAAAVHACLRKGLPGQGVVVTLRAGAGPGQDVSVRTVPS
jgi:hypothetical protein